MCIPVTNSIAGCRFILKNVLGDSFSSGIILIGMAEMHSSPLTLFSIRRGLSGNLLYGKAKHRLGLTHF